MHLWYNDFMQRGDTMTKDATAATRAKNKYRDKTYDQINVVVPKGKKTDLQTHAQKQGESLNGFVNRAIDETVERDKAKGCELTGED
jgi:predicted HicB family RNase H-like nuclease